MLVLKNFFNKKKKEPLYLNELINILSEHVFGYYGDNTLNNFKEALDTNKVSYKENIEKNDFNNFASLTFEDLTLRYEPKEEKFCLWFTEPECFIDFIGIEKSLKKEFNSVILENSNDEHNINTFNFF